MRVYALVETGDDQAVDLFLRHEDADAALAGCLRDEPSSVGLLAVVAAELDEDSFSLN
jgi:hypothetical protein